MLQKTEKEISQDAKKMVNDMISEFTARVDFLKDCMRYHRGLMKCNMIVEVGAFTVCSINGKMELQPTAKNLEPHQFDKETVAEIKGKTKYLNMNREELQFKEITFRQWYARELSSAEETLEHLLSQKTF